MKTSERGVAFIAAHEGVVTRAYHDVAGVWTIGIGHTAAAGLPKPVAGMTITRDEAFAILARDLPGYERRVASAFKNVTVDQAAFDGAVSFDFNTGAIDRASWVRALVRVEIPLARRQLMLWTKAGGKTVAGLVRRREAEARLIFDGVYGAEAVQAPPQTRALQNDLAALGFYKGAIDGIAGEATKTAILAYQRHHPDLVADGLAGPATRASIARDMALRENATGTIVAAAGVAAAAGIGTAGSGLHPMLLAALAGAAVLVSVGVFLLRRYGGEFRRAIFSKKES